jgi:hypothetical protein
VALDLAIFSDTWKRGRLLRAAWRRRAGEVALDLAIFSDTWKRRRLLRAVRGFGRWGLL